MFLHYQQEVIDYIINEVLPRIETLEDLYKLTKFYSNNNNEFKELQQRWDFLDSLIKRSLEIVQMSHEKGELDIKLLAATLQIYAESSVSTKEVNQLIHIMGQLLLEESEAIVSKLNDRTNID